MLEIGLHNPLGLASPLPYPHDDTTVFEPGYAFAGNEGVGVGDCNVDLGNTRFDDRETARRRPSVVVARLQSGVEDRSTSSLARLLERNDLGVVLAGRLRVPFAHNRPV